jgi:hypothetical protein
MKMRNSAVYRLMMTMTTKLSFLDLQHSCIHIIRAVCIQHIGICIQHTVCLYPTCGLFLSNIQGICIQRTGCFIQHTGICIQRMGCLYPRWYAILEPYFHFINYFCPENWLTNKKGETKTPVITPETILLFSMKII